MNTIQKWKKSKKPDRTYNFLMFEIVLALLVIMIGMFGVSSMFPVGVSSQKEAVGTSYITDAAEQLLRLNASYIRNDWDWLKVFADAKPGTNDQGQAWNSTTLFEVNNLRVKADAAFDLTSDNNSGLFLLEQLSLGKTDQAAIVRMWKDVAENDNGSIDATIYAEVSWPAEKPYYAREKEVFHLQVSKAPDIDVVTASYDDTQCTVFKVLDGGYSTTISDVIPNEDSTYTVTLTIAHDGCFGSECPELSQVYVEAEPGTYSSVSKYGVTGTIDLVPKLNDEDFDGFRVGNITGLGNGSAGQFILNYTLSALQDQYVLAQAGTEEYGVLLAVDDFEYVIQCVEESLDDYDERVLGENGETPDIEGICDADLMETNINPGNSNLNQFCLTKPGGDFFTRTELLNASVQSYNGPATKIFLRPKSDGNAIMVNGLEYPLSQASTYTIEGDIYVRLYNAHMNHPQNTAMGHWYICIVANSAIVTQGAQNDESDCVTSGMSGFAVIDDTISKTEPMDTFIDGAIQQGNSVYCQFGCGYVKLRSTAGLIKGIMLNYADETNSTVYADSIGDEGVKLLYPSSGKVVASLTLKKSTGKWFTFSSNANCSSTSYEVVEDSYYDTITPIYDTTTPITQ